MMDGPNILALAFLFLSFVCLTYQMVPENSSSNTENTATIITAAAGAILACTNSRGAAGGCVQRPYCNYSTTHIDRTVYGPPGYRNPCPGTGLCCPTEYILPVTEAPKSSKDDDVDFGDDD